MIKTFLTRIRNSYSLLWILLILGSAGLNAQVSYSCGCDSALDDELVEFRITINGPTVGAGEDWTITNSSNLFLGISPFTPVPNGFVIPATSGDPSVYEVTGFAFNNVLAFVSIEDPNGIPTNVELVTCMRPVAQLTVTSGEACLGANVELALDVTKGGIAPGFVNTASLVYTAPGSSSLMQVGDDVVVSYSQAGNFVVSVEGMTNDGCPFSTETSLAVMDASEGMMISGADLLCTANVTDIPYTVTNPNDLSLEWSLSPAGSFTENGMMVATGSGSSVAANFPPNVGTYTLSVNNRDPDGCTITGVSYQVEVVETIDTISIIGSTFLCLGEEFEYTIPNASSFDGLQWTVTPATGATLVPMTGMSDVVRLTIDTPGDYELSLEGFNADGCPIESSITVTGSMDESGSIACNNTVNVSLNNNCTLVLDADVILEGEDLNNDAYILDIFDETTGEMITSNMITQDQLGHSFIVTVTQRCGGNSCWGNLIVEDKSITPLSQFCSDDPSFTTCFEFDNTVNPAGFPDFPSDVIVTFRPATMDWLLVGFDNCSDAILTVSDNNTSADECTNPQTIERTWTVTDVNNGATSSCQTDVMVSLVDQSSIVFPPNFDTGLDAEMGNTMIPDTDNTFGSLDPCNTVGSTSGFPNPSLLCGTQWIPDENGNPSPDCTGRPSGLLCTNLELLGYNDDIIPICGNSRKILRRWSVLDACSNQTVMHTQIITIMDTRAPICSAPPETQAFTDLHECGASITLGAPLIAGECEETTFTVTYKLRDDRGIIPSEFSDEGVVFNPTTNTVTINDIPFDSDTLWVNYIVRDICGNETDECLTEIELIDNEQPVPACDLNSSVTLNDDGCAFATPGTFEDNSFDNCGVFTSVVQRMDDRCECELARFDFLDYLGEFNGNYYYLSKDRVHAGRAFALASSIEGHVATINTASENTWIRDQVDRFQNGERYFIGLTGTSNGDSVSSNALAWQSGTSAFRNWASAEPVIDLNINAPGDVHVFVEPDGTWEAERRNFTETYYVIERDVKCGWSQKVKFCCADVNQETMVALRVIDNFGNHNECWVNVNVRDVVAPEISCPADITVSCNVDVNTLTTMPTTSDLCGGVTVTENVGPDNFECGDDFVNITRTFTAADIAGNRSTCTQNIRKENTDPFNANDITFPRDFTFTNDRCTLEGLDPDDLPAGFQEPVIRAGECSSVVFTFDDVLFTIVDGYCQKLVRTWTVVDWCQPNLVFTGEQVIKLTNTIAPQISAASCSTMTVTDGNVVSECMVQVDGLVAELDDVNNNCSETILWSFTVQLNGSTVPSRSGNSNDASGVFPYGTHTITYTAEDACGNIDMCTKTLVVEDNVAPTPYCLGEVVLPLTSDGTIEVWANDFDLGSTDDCSNNTVTASFDANSVVANIVLDCDDLNPGSNRGDIDLQVFFLDGQGNSSFCTVNIQLQDNRNTCDNVGSGSRVVNIAGQIMTEELEMIDNVEVTIMSGDISYPQMNMAQSGEFAFTDLTAFEDYEITPAKDIDYLNGVSTLDLVMIQRHILGAVYLDSPYKIIAADIDNSETITAIDLIELRKLILGIYNEFPLNDSWRFVDASHTFVDETNPFPYPEAILYTDLAVDQMASNFMGVKIGDVNGSVQANFNSTSVEKRSNDSYEIAIQNAATEKGNTRIQFVAQEDIDVAGIQLTLDMSSNNQEIIAVIPMTLDISNENIAWDRIADGQLVMSWNGVSDVAIVEGEILFEVLLSGSGIGSPVQLMDGPLSSEVYESTGQEIEVREITITDRTSQAQDIAFSVNQNVPNPFKDETVIEFVLPTDSQVTFNVTDQNGRTIYSKTNNYNAGNQQIVVQADDLNASGVLYYQLSTEQYTTTKRMIIIR